MMRKRLLAVLLALTVTACAHAPSLVQFANNAELVAHSPSPMAPLFVRLFRLQAVGECDGPRCPEVTMQIAVSESGEYPRQALFATPPADDWQFVEWGESPRDEGDIGPVVFTLKTTRDGVSRLLRFAVTLDGLRPLD
ncbi:MAG: hypothetical protein FHP94_15965 [Denitromonas halophila]|nr:MAG: hypothetical protein FHP94_15965 [Denitromonas halophila]TVT66383.1 MAG: hypothetical protein FHP93_18980 [Denitromonas halophila]